jgi:hypothetical protein
MPSRITNKTYGTVSADRQKEMSGLEFCPGARRRDAATQYVSADLAL